MSYIEVAETGTRTIRLFRFSLVTPEHDQVIHTIPSRGDSLNDSAPLLHLDGAPLTEHTLTTHGFTIDSDNSGSNSRFMPPEGTRLFDLFPVIGLNEWLFERVDFFTYRLLWWNWFTELDMAPDAMVIPLDLDGITYDEIENATANANLFFDIDLFHLAIVCNMIDHYARRGEFPYCPPFEGSILDQWAPLN